MPCDVPCVVPCDVPCDVEMRCGMSGLLKYTLTEDTVTASEQCVSQTLFFNGYKRRACQVQYKYIMCSASVVFVILQQF